MPDPVGRERATEILVAGGGTGGCAAALAALRLGRQVVMTEESWWIGGQLTSQSVPPDEHPWIETIGSSGSYRELRRRVRDHYRRNHPLTEAARGTVALNPGAGIVSAICHEPRASLAALEAMLAPYRTSRQLEVLLRARPVAATTEGDRVTSVTVRSLESGQETVLTAPFVIDATELGDVLELAGVEHVVGAESQDDTGELHALPGPPQPMDQQAISWCFAIDHLPGEDHTIDRPAGYEHWRDHHSAIWPGPQLSWTDISPVTLEERRIPLFARGWFDLWRFRRIVHADLFDDPALKSDLTLVNWPQIDYWGGPLVGVPEADADEHRRRSGELSLSFLHWMQTEAPRHDGGAGYPGLRLRGDVMGTEHGLAQQAYIRESRRILAERTVLEQDVGVEQRGDLVGASIFDDSVGTGCYRIDLHPSTAGRTYVDIACYPFQIPLGALLPIRVENLLPGAKNLGVTHITNGCYRLHPVEWGIGEAAGALAAHCLAEGLAPRQVRARPDLLADFQRLLRGTLRVDVTWPEHARTTPA